MGKIDVSIFPCRKGVVPVAPHLPKPKQTGAKNIFEKLLFWKHSKIRCSSRDIYFQSLTTFSAFSLLSCYKHDHNLQGS
jgi:hypothetical protein